jgi:hypothetical protein
VTTKDRPDGEQKKKRRINPFWGDFRVPSDAQVVDSYDTIRLSGKVRARSCAAKPLAAAQIFFRWKINDLAFALRDFRDRSNRHSTAGKRLKALQNAFQTFGDVHHGRS